MPYNILQQEDLVKLKRVEPERFKYPIEGGQYLNLQNLELSGLDGIDTGKLEKAAQIMRGLMFCALEASHSGHPGGSSSKTEQFLGMVLGGGMAFDALNPKNPGRDRVVWSAGHCSPCLYGGLSLLYESLRKSGKEFDPKNISAVMPEDLVRFRKSDGPQGHIENYTPLSDIATGPSGHGFPAAGGLAISHKSSGLDTNVWVMMGDAESEEGMTYEARNVLNTVGADNMIVSLDYNHYGIDGDINEVVASQYINHWIALGWNVIEISGHNVLECIYAYRLAANKFFDNNSPTVVIAHTIKGRYYGKNEDTADSHGAPASSEEYVEIMEALGFDVPGKEGGVKEDIDFVLSSLDDELANYISSRLEEVGKKIKSEEELVKQMEAALSGRALTNPMEIKRPDELPDELKFEEGTNLATRKATQAFFEWLMKETAFFWAGTGDLSKSILTSKAEQVHGLVNRSNPLGRGIRFGIAEQNMAMMSAAMTADRLPGGFAPVSVFSSYGVFTSMMSNCVRLILIGNHLNPKSKGFFVMLAAHDGPETGEDGPTHQGLYWMSMFNAYPGIKVYKPMDANETIEMLFHAIEKGEPIALSVARPDTPVFKRGDGVPPAREAVNGAYVFRNYQENGGKKVVLVISGMQVLVNTLESLPNLESQGLDVKIIAVTSPELFEELRKENPEKANSIFSDEERERTVALHAGWKGFLYPFLLPKDYDSRSISIDNYLKSGSVAEVYEEAKLTPDDISERVKKAIS